MIQLLTRNLGWKILSLLIAVLLWVAVAREPEVATSFSVPVDFKNMRDDLDIEGSLPDRVRLEVRGPSGSLTRDNLSSVAVVLDHGVVTLQIGQRRRVLRLADYPQLAPLIDSIRATLAGDRAALERVFEVAFSGTLEHWQLQLAPRDPQLAAGLKRIDMQGERDAVREVRVEQSDGDRSVMSITPRE